MIPASISDYRELARRRLPRVLFEYLDGGATDEVTLRRNRSDLDTLTLRQRVMRDMSNIDLSVELLGESWSFPVAMSPVGLAGMYARRGEIQAARAAARAGIPYCLSTVGICSAAEISVAARPPWFQLYMLRDRAFMQALLERAKAAGCRVLVFTVDLPLAGIRYRDVRSGFASKRGRWGDLRRAWQGASHPNWLWDVWLRGRPHTLGSIDAGFAQSGSRTDFLEWIGKNFDRGVTWADMEWVRQNWDGPIVIKGILDPEDAENAIKAGANALIVSNHGGRQLDGVRSSISALPAVLHAVGADVPVFVDGGIRSGTDVLKALALGASGCFIGRPWVYALSAGGAKMVEQLLQNLRAELTCAMILNGNVSIKAIDATSLDCNAAAKAH